MTYMGYVMQEALRLNPPASTTSMYSFEKDTQLGPKFKVKAGEVIIVNHMGLHKNASYW